MRRVLLAGVAFFATALFMTGCGEEITQDDLAYEKEISYDAGYEQGYSEGKNDYWYARYEEGYDAGFAEGEAEGYDKGLSDGWEFGYSSGVEDGKKQSGSSSGTRSSSNGSPTPSRTVPQSQGKYFVTRNGKCFHRKSCQYNPYEWYATREDAIADGYSPCSKCDP